MWGSDYHGAQRQRSLVLTTVVYVLWLHRSAISRVWETSGKVYHNKHDSNLGVQGIDFEDR